MFCFRLLWTLLHHPLSIKSARTWRLHCFFGLQLAGGQSWPTGWKFQTEGNHKGKKTLSNELSTTQSSFRMVSMVLQVHLMFVDSNMNNKRLHLKLKLKFLFVLECLGVKVKGQGDSVQQWGRTGHERNLWLGHQGQITCCTFKAARFPKGWILFYF